jgi:hypothetical protein
MRVRGWNGELNVCTEGESRGGLMVSSTQGPGLILTCG